jgi:mannosyltransferase
VSENAVSSLGAGAEVMPADSAPTALGTAHSLAARATGLLALAGPLLALGLGSLLLARRPLTVDEADAVAAATGPFGDVVEHALEHDPARVGYLALLQPVVQIDDGERWVRAPSVLAAALASLLVYFVGKALAGRVAGVAASLALATAGSVVAVSQQARPYTLAILAVTLSTALFVLALRREHPALWALYAVGSAFLPFTHPAASAAVLAQALALALVVPRPSLRFAGPALGFVALENALLLTAFGLDRSDAPDTPLALGGIGEGLARACGWNPVVAGLAVWGVVALALRRAPGGEPWGAALTAGLALLPLFGLLLASLVISVLPETALVVGAPGVALAAGAGIAALPQHWMRWAAGGAAAGAMLVGVIAWYATPSKQDWRTAAAFVDTEAAPHETVVVLPDRARAALAYYAPEVRLMLTARGDGAWVVIAGDPDRALRAARTVVATPRYALLDQRTFGEELVVQHWVRP